MKILVFGAHPDDEVLGAGGSMAKWVNQGHDVHVRLLTDNTLRHNQSTPLDVFVQYASKVLGGLASSSSFGFPDQKLHTMFDNVVMACEQSIEELQPDLIVTHSMKDLNADHRVVAEATLVASRPTRTTANVLAYAVAGSNFGQPHGQPDLRMFVRLSDIEVCKKIDAYEAYSLESVESPNPRSSELVQAQMRIWGGAAGCRWAEAFEVVRWCA